MVPLGETEHEALLRTIREMLEEDMNSVPGLNGNSIREPKRTILVMYWTNGAQWEKEGG
jgi:hypothetical protein